MSFRLSHSHLARRINEGSSTLVFGWRFAWCCYTT